MLRYVPYVTSEHILNLFCRIITYDMLILVQEAIEIVSNFTLICVLFYA